MAALEERDTNTNPAAHVAFDRPVASPYHATTPAIWRWFDTYNSGRTVADQVRPFNFLLAFQIHPMADEPWEEGQLAETRKRRRRARAADKTKPVAQYDPDPLKAARQCFDRETGKRVPIDDLETYREALAQYHLYPETKFLNGGYRDRGPTVRRHVKIELTDIHYIGKEANELDEQVSLGFDPEVQPEYGMESEAYAKLLANVRGALTSYYLEAASKATGVSIRYLRKIRDGLANATVAILTRIGSAVPALEASHIQAVAYEQRLLAWARSECDRIGLRPLASRLRTDPANLAKVLRMKRRASRALLASVTALASQASRYYPKSDP